MGCKYIVDTSQPDYKKTLGKMAMKLRPSTCLECVAGDTSGDMLEYMGFGSTMILYGLLSEKPASNINVIGFIGKSQTIESFLLTNWLNTKTLTQHFEIVMKAESLYKTVLSTTVNARYGFDQITDAIDFYMKNQTAGKILLKSSLTGKQ